MAVTEKHFPLLAIRNWSRRRGLCNTKRGGSNAHEDMWIRAPPTKALRPRVGAKALSSLAKVLQAYGGFLRDQTGLGKTKLVLLMLAFYVKFAQEENVRPILILVPANLIRQWIWIKEIRESWPGFLLWIMWSEEDLGTANVLETSHILCLPFLSDLPLHMCMLFDKTNSSHTKKSSIILSSYASFKDRTAYVFEAKWKDNGGKEVKREEWRSRLTGMITHVLLDEGHRAQTRDTKTHASIIPLQADYMWIFSATMQNSEKVRAHQKYFWIIELTGSAGHLRSPRAHKKNEYQRLLRTVTVQLFNYTHSPMVTVIHDYAVYLSSQGLLLLGAEILRY